MYFNNFLYYGPEQEEVFVNIFDTIESIRTVGDLIEYTRTCESPVTGDMIQSALRFFMEDCKQITPKPAFWKAVKERHKLGLKFQLTPEHELTREICDAVRSWMLHPQYGRDIGNSYLDAMFSHTVCGISDPRSFAFDIISLLKFRLMISSTDVPDEEIVHLYQWSFARERKTSLVRKCVTAMLEMYREHLLIATEYYDKIMGAGE